MENRWFALAQILATIAGFLFMGFGVTLQSTYQSTELSFQLVNDFYENNDRFIDIISSNMSTPNFRNLTLLWGNETFNSSNPDEFIAWRAKTYSDKMNVTNKILEANIKSMQSLVEMNNIFFWGAMCASLLALISWIWGAFVEPSVTN